MVDEEHPEPPLAGSGGPELPVTFVVSGVPASGQSRRTGHWKARVAGAAVEFWGDAAPLDRDVSVTIVYYFADTSLDVDNMAKPILDALTGLVIRDDGAVSRLTVRKTRLAGGFSVIGAPPEVARAIDNQQDFVYVRVDEPPDHWEFP